MGAICAHTRGRILAEGEARREALANTEAAHDAGHFAVGEVALHLMNEWIAVEAGGERLATFPGVITTLDTATGAQVAAGRGSGWRCCKSPARGAVGPGAA